MCAFLPVTPRDPAAKELIMPLYELVIWFLLHAIGAPILPMTILPTIRRSRRTSRPAASSPPRDRQGHLPAAVRADARHSEYGRSWCPLSPHARWSLPAILMTYLFTDSDKRDDAFYAGSASIRAAYMILIISLLFRRHPRTYKNIRHTAYIHRHRLHVRPDMVPLILLDKPASWAANRRWTSRRRSRHSSRPPSCTSVWFPARYSS